MGFGLRLSFFGATLLVALADLRPEDIKCVAALQQSGITHIRIEDAGTFFKAGVAVLRPVKLSRHCQRIDCVGALENAKISAAQDFRMAFTQLGSGDGAVSGRSDRG